MQSGTRPGRSIPLAGRSPGRLNRFVAEQNADPTPFTWTADPRKIIAAVNREQQVLDPLEREGLGFIT